MQTWALTKIEFCMWTAARPVILNFWTLPTLKNPVWYSCARGAPRSYIGDNASAGPTYACAGGKLRMQLGLQDAVCHAMLMVCSRAYVPGLAKGYNTGLNRW